MVKNTRNVYLGADLIQAGAELNINFSEVCRAAIDAEIKKHRAEAPQAAAVPPLPSADNTTHSPPVFLTNNEPALIAFKNQLQAVADAQPPAEQDTTKTEETGLIPPEEELKISESTDPIYICDCGAKIPPGADNCPVCGLQCDWRGTDLCNSDDYYICPECGAARKEPRCNRCGYNLTGGNR